MKFLFLSFSKLYLFVPNAEYSYSWKDKYSYIGLGAKIVSGNWTSQHCCSCVLLQETSVQIWFKYKKPCDVFLFHSLAQKGYLSELLLLSVNLSFCYCEGSIFNGDILVISLLCTLLNAGKCFENARHNLWMGIQQWHAFLLAIL